MIEICLLGTGAMMPLPKRRLAAMLMRRKGRLLLIDCGEGTQVAVRESGWSLARIDTICITHFHADHMAGLPGLLLTMGTCGRTEPVTLIGPEGLEMVVRCLRVIAPELPFPLRFEEMTGPLYETAFHDVELTGFAMDHVIPCYGYGFTLNRPGKFLPEKAKALGIPVSGWHGLQNGDTVIHEGAQYTPDMVIGPPRKGIKLVYCTDTRATEAMVAQAQDADVLICEGTYAEEENAPKASLHGHMTFCQAATLARRANVKELLLTHFSPAVEKPSMGVEEARRIFPHVTAGHDLLHKAILFEKP